MQGRFWYLALVVIGSIVIAITYWKSRNKHTFTLLFGNAGVCYFIEAFLHTTLKAYEFFPGFIPDKYADSVLGGIVSDLFIFPSADVLVGVVQLGWGWMIVVSGIITGIDALFVHIGIYEHYWWKTLYTFFAIMPFLYLSKVWYRRLNRPHGSSLTFITMLPILYFFSIQLDFCVTLYLKQAQYVIKWITSLGINTTIILVPINLLFALSLTILITYRVRWFWEAILIAGFTGFDLVLDMLKVLQPTTYWLFLFLLMARVSVLFIGLAFYQLLRNNEVQSAHAQEREDVAAVRDNQPLFLKTTKRDRGRI